MRLSVCIPTYNREAFLADTLESVIAQATDEVEIVVSDNASEDDTEGLVARFKERFARITYHRAEANQGADRNYLKAVELAQGDYCWLLGSDDRIAPGALATVLAAIDGADVLLGDRVNMDRQLARVLWTEALLTCPAGTDFDGGREEEMLAYLHSAPSVGGIFSYISAIVVRREAWNAVPVREEFLGSAWIHVTKLLDVLIRGGRLRYLGVPIVWNRTANDTFLAEVGYTRRVLLDLDYARIARVVLAGRPALQEAVIDMLARMFWASRVMLQHKRLATRADGPEGARQLHDAYRTTFAGRRGLAWRLALWRLSPVPWLEALEAARGTARRFRPGIRTRRSACASS